MGEKDTTPYGKILGTVLILLIASYFAYGYFVQSKPSTTTSVAASPTPQAVQLSDYLSYQGETGKNALILLKEHAKVEQDTSGLVSSINGRKADPNKQEFWAFYVNGKLAPVGPLEYQTKDGDLIEWKIEKY